MYSHSDGQHFFLFTIVIEYLRYLVAECLICILILRNTDGPVA